MEACMPLCEIILRSKSGKFQSSQAQTITYVQVKNEECYVLHKSQFNALGKQTTVLKGECSKEDQKNVNQAYAHTQNKYF